MRAKKKKKTVYHALSFTVNLFKWNPKCAYKIQVAVLSTLVHNTLVTLTHSTYPYVTHQELAH